MRPEGLLKGDRTVQVRRVGIAGVLLVSALALLSSSAQVAGNGGELAQEKRCYACHAMSEPLIGPPYLAIAALHANADRDIIVEVLARKIIIGGAGNWGVVPMVPSEHVTSEEARTIAAWILDLQEPQPARRGVTLQ